MNDSTTHSIYRIVCFPTCKVYVGQTIHVKNRIQQHLRDLSNGKHHSSHLQYAYNKYGKQSFYFEVVEVGISSADVNQREIYWIAYFDSYQNGYNGTPGGDIGNSSGRPCEWNGVEYPSVSAAAIANDVPQNTMDYRIMQGYTCDDDVRPLTKSCVWEGVEYPSVKQAAKELGISYKALQARLKKGHTRNSDSKRIATRHCVWNGIEYKSVLDCARAVGIKSSTLDRYFSKGYTCDSDVEKPANPFTWNGIEYPSISVASNVLNVKVATLSWRLNKGYTSDSDMGEFNYRKKCSWNGTEYESVSACATALGLSSACIVKRLAKGYTCDADVKK